MNDSQDRISWFGRLAIAMLGLALVSAWDSNSLLRECAGLVGVALILAASGLVELAMASHYRAQRRRSASS